LDSGEQGDDADNFGNVMVATPMMGEIIDEQPAVVVDTTAELLGRAKPKRPRTRSIAAAPSAGRRVTKKAEPGPARKTSRARKTAKSS
jgi:hypothetical protein